MDGKHYYSNHFSVDFDGQRKIESPILLLHGIIKEISFCDVEDPVRNQNVVQK